MPGRLTVVPQTRSDCTTSRKLEPSGVPLRPVPASTHILWYVQVASMKVGMIKHKEVAMELDGEMFGCVCKFDDAPRTTRPSMDVLRE